MTHEPTDAVALRAEIDALRALLQSAQEEITILVGELEDARRALLVAPTADLPTPLLSSPSLESADAPF